MSETKSNIKTVGFEFPTEGEWIYESPDGGQTIYRRKMGDVNTQRELVKQKAPLIAEMMDGVEEPSELDILRQKVVNLEMANADLKDMLRNMGVAI